MSQGFFNLQGDAPMGAYGQFGNMTQADFASFSSLYFMAGSYWILVVITGIVLYILMAWSFMRISQKTKIGYSWFAWVPILNVILWLNLGGLSGWYIFVFLLAFIPFLGWLTVFLFMVYVWMGIAKNNKKPDYVGLLALIPGGQLLLPLYLAFM